ncbi:MAG: hypothetical protein RL172_2175 [Bacteroidota bacterium]
MQPVKHILVIRFSSMGDVAMTVPVIKNVLDQNPQVHITVLSAAFFEPLFTGIERCHFVAAHLKTTHKGLAGIYRLSRQLLAGRRIDAVADLHNLLRSKMLRCFLKTKRIPAAAIDKGRRAKKALTQTNNKVFTQLTPMHERYAAVFRELGITVELDSSSPALNQPPLPAAAQALFSSGTKTIGVAPFAQHSEKMYPLEKTKAVVQQLANSHYRVLLFGAKGREAELLQQWCTEIPNVHAVAGTVSFKEELAIISHLHGMISMDSANMHLASLYAVPVVSIWGATHPYAGFYGWGQDENNIVSVNLFCRPCSVFGNKPCYRGDHACMQQVSVPMVVQKVLSVI